MRKKILNGTPIPYGASIEELKMCLSSPSMKDFSLACEALSHSNHPEAYAAMKAYINDEDKYRRLYILKTIFRHPQATELANRLEESLADEDVLFVRAALTVIAEHKIKVADAALVAAILRHLPDLGGELLALHTLTPGEENYTRLTMLFKKATTCSQREFISEVLLFRYLPEKASDLFELFGHDPHAKIRILSVKIGREYSLNISDFLHDPDGHVRKQAQ